MKNGCDCCCKTSRADDIGKLLLRLVVGGLMLFHGWAKIKGGVTGVSDMLKTANLPEIMAYGVYVGEVLAPVMIIVGLWARPAALVLAINMGMAIYLAHSAQILDVDPIYGAYALEVPTFYLVGALAIAFLGSGRFGIFKKSAALATLEATGE